MVSGEDRKMRRYAIAAALLVLIASARIVSTYTVFNHTIDEPDHLAAGMEWLSGGKYLYEDQHPPLARIFGALGPFLAGERWHAGPASYQEGYRLLGHGEHYDRILALGRAGMLPFFWLAALMVFLWASRLGGAPAALAATLIFTSLPPVLAHAGLIATDMAVTAWIAAAAYISLLWAENPARKRSLALGAAAGCAVLCKFSALLFLPAGWLAMCAYSAPWRWPRSEIFRRVRPLALVLAVAVLVIWGGYRFSFARVDFLHLRLPAPRLFTGIRAVWRHQQVGHGAYLLDRRSETGFWYYFPVALGVKTPLSLMILLCGIFWLPPRRKWAMAIPLAFSLGILISALPSRIDIGVRHILPVYIGLAVAGGVTAAAARGRAPRVAAGALLLWLVVSGALRHPDYLAYTNEIAGGRPEAFLADSDLDWGQDMKRLGKYLAQAGARQVTFAPFNRTYGAVAGHALPPMAPGFRDHPSPGWNAVSISMWKIFGDPAWPDRLPAPTRIGRSILVWYFPPNGGPRE